MHLSLLLAGVALAIPHEAIVDRFIQPCEYYWGPFDKFAVTERRDDPETIVMRHDTRGLFESHDGGVSWVPTTPPHMCVLPVQTFFNPQPAAGEPWCLGTLDADQIEMIFCSTDRGHTFARLSYRLPTEFSHIDAFRVDPFNPRRMVLHVTRAFGGDLLLQSKDGGANWHTWQFPGIKNDHVSLGKFLADGSILATVAEGNRRRPGRARVVRYKPGSRGKMSDIQGPWKKTELPFIEVDSARPDHWFVATYTRSGPGHAYESFDGGENFARLPKIMSGYVTPVFLADGGLAFLSQAENGNSVLHLRHGQAGEFIQIDAPDLSDRLHAAANTLFLAQPQTDGIYRLDESEGPSNAAWRRIDPEVTP